MLVFKYMDWIILWLMGMFLFFLADSIFVGGLMWDFYREKLGSLVGRGEWEINKSAGFLAYAALSLGLVFLVVPLARDLGEAVLYGAIYGLAVYGVYDFTNASIFKKYPNVLVFADLIWGIFVSAVVTGVIFCFSGF